MRCMCVIIVYDVIGSVKFVCVIREREQRDCTWRMCLILNQVYIELYT